MVHNNETEIFFSNQFIAGEEGPPYSLQMIDYTNHETWFYQEKTIIYFGRNCMMFFTWHNVEDLA